jgi:RNA polymerase sigma-70 factor (ECF subfamily)
MSDSLEWTGVMGWRRTGEETATESDDSSPEYFAALYEDHVHKIYSYLLAHTRRSEDAADLTQQVFTQAFAAHPRYRQREAPASAWLFRIAHNLMVDFHRKQRPTVAWQVLPERSQPAGGDDVEGTVINREDVARLRLALAGLEGEKRELLALRFAARLTVREMAAVLDLRDAAVRSQLRRLLKTLHKEMSKDRR